jgi:hypothetical protein
MEVEVPAEQSLEPLLDSPLQGGASSGTSSVSQQTRKALSLPKTVSKRNSRKPLVTQGCRRSSRLNIFEGFKHSQLPDKTPRKKRKVLDSAAFTFWTILLGLLKLSLPLPQLRLFNNGGCSAMCLLVSSQLMNL